MSDLQQRIEGFREEALSRISGTEALGDLDALRVELLGKKGRVTAVLRGMADVPVDERPAAGRKVNELKDALEEAIGQRRRELTDRQRAARLTIPQLDVTMPAWGPAAGHEHPLTRTMAEMCSILCSMGFAIAEGPDVEDERHNFEALNIPADHPARDMQDTFFVEGGHVLRTHTSPVQIRVMESQPPPIRIIAPGAVYRHDDDVTHSPMFHQVEGLLVDESVTFADLKGVLTEFLARIFARRLPVRFRPSYFPFTEPSAEVDIGCVLCDASGVTDRGPCRICSSTGWLEILGCGMVDPAVFEQVGYDPERYRGFAFGLGVERIAMLRYGIDDIRSFYGGDLRFLRQF